MAEPPFRPKPPRRGLKKKGYDYEQRCHEELLDRYGMEHYFPSQWFQFQTRGRSRTQYCQTDGIVFQPESRSVLLLEMKWRHCAEAYFQCEYKYGPILQMLFPDWTLTMCEVVHWFDTTIPFPTEVTLTPEPLNLRPNQFGVHILNP